MSKAEERALRAYPPKIDGDSRGSYDFNELNRIKYLQGYHQAEKDLELGWEDMMAIDDLLDELLPPRRNSDELVLKGYYEEVLKRFNKQKGK